MTDTSAVLNGTINPQGAATQYSFQYGTSTAYGAQTAVQSAGAATKNTQVSAGITGLAPNTTYHYRLVAQNASGTVVGADQRFTTKKPGDALTVGYSPNPVVYGHSLAVTGTLNATPKAGVAVALQARPYPYTGAFAQFSNTQLTDGNGAFRFSLKPLVSAQYRVVAGASPTITSSITTVGVRVFVSSFASDRTPRRGQLVRFYGSVRPVHSATAYIQKRSPSGVYRTVARNRLRRVSSTRSAYSRRVRVYRSGRYRVKVTISDGDHVSGYSTSRYLRVH